MRKLLLLFLTIGLSIIITACGGNNFAGETKSETSSDESKANNGGSEENKEPENKASDPKLELETSTGGAWKDSIDTVWVHSSAVYVNTGDVPVDIGETQMTFKGTDGSVLGTASSVYSVPEIVEPGEKAFVTQSTILEGVTDPAEYAETTYNFGFDKAEDSPNLLEVSGIKGTKGNEYTLYKVTGMVKNTTKELQDDIRLSAALYGEDGSLLGILEGSISAGVNPGGEAGFELNYPEIPKDVVDKIAEVEVKAFGWSF